MRNFIAITLLLLNGSLFLNAQAEPRPRARELGITPGMFEPGPLNAIIPHPGNVFQDKVPAAIVVANGFGKLIGSTQVNELGVLETPIILTSTLNVWEGAAALAGYTLAQKGNEQVRSINPVVGETNDGWLNDLRQRPLKIEHAGRSLHAFIPGHYPKSRGEAR